MSEAKYKEIQEYRDLLKKGIESPTDDALFIQIIDEMWNPFLIRKFWAVGGPTIGRWMEGKSSPHPFIRVSIYRSLEKELDEIEKGEEPEVLDIEPCNYNAHNYEYYCHYYKILPTDKFKVLSTDWTVLSLIYFDHKNKIAINLADSSSEAIELKDNVQQLIDYYEKKKK